jgi:hypothetical protein
LEITIYTQILAVLDIWQFPLIYQTVIKVIFYIINGQLFLKFYFQFEFHKLFEYNSIYLNKNFHLLVFIKLYIKAELFINLILS